jgi:hypothetical protein
VPQIEVTFDIDANGIVHVSAKDLGTAKEQSIKITANSGLSDEEIKKMVKDAEAHAEEDKAKRELIEARNQLDSLVYASERSMKEFGEKLSADEKAVLRHFGFSPMLLEANRVLFLFWSWLQHNQDKILHAPFQLCLIHSQWNVILLLVFRGLALLVFLPHDTDPLMV